jgi:hypothetical protein
MTTTTLNTAASNPAQIDPNALLDLATFHLSTAAECEREHCSGPAAGTMAAYLAKVDDLVAEIEDSEDPMLIREWAGRLAFIFRIGVDFGIEVAAAIVNHPFGDSRMLLAGPLKTAMSELQDCVDSATEDAARTAEGGQS